MDNIMILGASETQIPFIKIAKNKGCGVIITDINKDAPAFKYADIALNINAIDKEEVLYYAKKFKIVGILTKIEKLLSTVAYVNEKLNLIGISSKAAKASNDKFFLRKCMEESNIIIPDNWIIRSLNEFKVIKNELKYPVVIKPVDASGSRGVIKINNEGELIKKFDCCKQYSDNGQIIIEEYIEGREYSVETVTQNEKTYIIAITEKTTKGCPYFVESRHVLPAKLTELEKRQIEEIVYKTLNAIELDNSICHTELKLTIDGPKIIELGARFGGDYICTDLIELATGINMYENLINIILGKNIVFKNKFNLYSGIQFIDIYNLESTLTKHDKIIKDNNFIRYEYYNKNNIKKLTSSSDRLGYYIFCSKDRESLLRSLDFINE